MSRADDEMMEALVDTVLNFLAVAGLCVLGLVILYWTGAIK